MEALAPPAALVLLAVMIFSAPASSNDLPWKRAELTATKLFLSGQTLLSLSANATGDEVTLHLDSRFVGRRTESRLRIDRATGATLERVKIRHGSEPYQKTYRFENDAVTEHRASPANAREREKSPESWSKVRERKHPVPAGCRNLIHPEGLLWLAATQAPLPGTPPLERCAFTGDGFARITISAVERIPSHSDAEVHGPEGLLAGPSEVVILRLEGRALDGAAADDLDFLGLEGDITLQIDPALGAPVRVTGEISPLGTVHVRLRRLEI